MDGELLAGFFIALGMLVLPEVLLLAVLFPDELKFWKRK